jgi:hypothetical protein
MILFHKRTSVSLFTSFIAYFKSKECHHLYLLDERYDLYQLFFRENLGDFFLCIIFSFSSDDNSRFLRRATPSLVVTLTQYIKSRCYDQN